MRARLFAYASFDGRNSIRRVHLQRLTLFSLALPRHGPSCSAGRRANFELLEGRDLLAANLTPANVLVLYNPASPDGTQIASYYAQVHPGVKLLGINGVDPSSEDITADAYLSTIRPQVLAALTPSIDVIVTTKGLPLRIDVTEPEPTAIWPALPSYTDPSGTLRSILTWQPYSSLESELTNVATVSSWQMMGDQSRVIPGQFSGNPYFHSTNGFSSSAYGGMYLTSRLDGYTVSDVEGAIDRAHNATIGPNNSPSGPDWFLVDNTPSINYAPTMANLVNTVLLPAGLPVVYDDTLAFISTAPGPVIGYDSQGVHQASTPANYITNGLNITLANGAVFNSWESYNAYSFTPGGYTGSQGQVAQWLAIGGTAGVGNVQEPGASPSSVANEDQMFQMLLSGKTWAEAAWSSLPQLGYVNTVVGDPLMTWKKLSAPVVTLNSPSAGNTTSWSPASGPVNIASPVTATITDADSTNLTSLTVSLGSPQPGDVLAANTSGTSITANFAGGVLTLNGSDIVANYQQVLRSVTYNNTSGGPGVNVETVNVVANDGTLSSNTAVATINIPPVVSLAIGAGSPNYTANWFNSGPVALENMAQASVTDAAGLANISSLTVTLTTFHTGDVLSVPILAGNTAISASYSAGTLTLTGTATLAQYSQELRLVNYNNTAGGPGTTPITATFVASDGVLSSTPATATINVSVASGQVLGNRLFYNNSKYDANNAAINASDDAAIASDKVGFNGTGVATFANVSSATRGITGVMIDLASGLGTHTNINLTSGDITFKVAPTSFVAGTYNQLSTWTTAPMPTAISVRLGAGTGGSDRLEITWDNGAIKNTWLEVDVHAGGYSGLSADDVFYFGSAIGDSGLGDTAALAKVDINDANAVINNTAGLTTPAWNILDYTKDGKVDVNDLNAGMNGIFTVHYLANPIGPYAPDGGGGAAAPAAVTTASAAAVPATSTTNASSTVSSGLSLLNSLPTTQPNWLAGRLQGILSSQPIAKILKSLTNPNSPQSNQVLQTIDQVAAQFNLHDDVLDGLLLDLGLAS
jgi:uncharacterized protein (TIGR03790 family)